MSEEFNDYLTYNIGDKFWVLNVMKNWKSEKIRMVFLVVAMVVVRALNGSW